MRLNSLRFLAERALRLKDVVATDVFDYLDWQRQPASTAKSAVVVKLSSRAGVTPATMNRRIAAVRGLFEYAVVAGLCARNPVPPARRSTGVRAVKGDLLGHLGPDLSMKWLDPSARLRQYSNVPKIVSLHSNKVSSRGH